MSTIPDQLVTLLSRRLAGHVGDADVLRALEAVADADLPFDSREAVGDLRASLANGADRGEREMLVREALEALVFS